jgi:VWFA-related protein
MLRRKILTMFVLAPLAGAQQAEPETAPPVFRMEVSLITVDAKVTGRDGSDIGNLSASDFVVFDEGQRQRASHFGRESTPIDLLLVLDVSSSMRPFLLELTPRVTDSLSPLRTGDRAGVMLFATRSQLVQPLTDDLIQAPRKTVSTIYKDGLGRTTLLNEALLSAARYIREQPATGRRTIIVLTDNEAMSGAVGDNEVVRELHGSDAVLNAILMGVKGDIPKVTPGYRDPSSRRPDVSRFVEATGGELVASDDPARALRRVVQQATTRYSLQFPAPGGEPGSFRRIRVELSGAAQARYPGAVVKARSGYDVPK